MTTNEKILIEYLDDYGLDIFSFQQIRKSEILPEKYLEIALRGLYKKDIIRHVEKGVYCRHNLPEEFVIGNFFVNEGGIAYWSAMNYHGLTEQIPNVVFVQTNQRKTDKIILGVKYKFVQVKNEKITGYKTEVSGGHKFNITDIEKTIVDCFDLPQHAGGYPEIIKAFYRAKLNARKMVKYCKAINNISIVKRFGYLTEFLNKTNMDYFMKYAQSVVNEKYSPFESGGEKKGSTNRKWRLILNMSVSEILEIAES